MEELLSEAKRIREIIAKKVTGKIVPRHDDFGHHYEFVKTGKIVDSVTTKIILDKPHLKKWYARQALEWMEPMWMVVGPENREDMLNRASLAGDRKRDDAGDVGTHAHNIVDLYLQEWINTGIRPNSILDFVTPGTDNRSIAGARSAEKMFLSKNVIPVASEILVGDEKLGIAGTMDFIAFFDGKLMVSDWKTSNSVSDDYALQVAAYWHCFQKMTGIKVEGCNLVQLDKKYDKYTLYDIPNHREAFATYKQISDVYEWSKNGKKKLIKDENILQL